MGLCGADAVCSMYASFNGAATLAGRSIVTVSASEKVASANE